MVIESVSSFLSKHLKMSDPDHPASEEVLRWQINIYLNYFFTFVLVLIVGLFTGKVIGSLISMMAFIVLRKYSGGMHLRSITVCTILSAAIFSVIPLIEISYVWALNIVSAIIFLKYAPNYAGDEVTESNKLSDIQLKIVCIVVVMSNMIFNSSVLALTFFVQAILVFPLFNKHEGRCV